MADASELFEAVAGSTSVDPKSLDRLHEYADEAIALEQIVNQLQADLDVASKALNAIKTKTLPELMTELGMESLTRNGQVFETHDFVSGSLPKDEDKRQKAIAWLEANGGAGLIKTNLSMAFGKDDREEAIRIYKLLKSNGVEPQADTGVHSATLQAFARERLKNGETIDTETLGLYTGRVVKIKEAKKGKRK